MLARLFRSDFTLSHPLLVAFKSSMATALALSANQLTGNSDHVSAAFVAVLSIAPTIYQGLREAFYQFLGSFCGGISSAVALSVCLYLGWPTLTAVPPAVFGAILLAFFIRHPRIYIVSAFTALFLPITLHGSALETLGGRLLAVATGALSGFITNTAVSSFSHQRIFNRRLRNLLCPAGATGNFSRARAGCTGANLWAPFSV